MRVVVIGGGIGGLTSALIFKRIGFNVKLLEATVGPLSSSSLHRNALHTGLWNPTLQILKHCDLFQEIEKNLEPVSQIRFQDLDGNLLAQSSPLKTPPGPESNCLSH
jgi:2-polyprenyl-6-methoxyphenol hydroxylase-like FAD-dependent oxidoreductase